MDAQTIARIDRYQPKSGVADVLGVEGVRAVRAAVLASEPAGCSEASRRLTHAAAHAAWAVGEGEPLALPGLFAAALVERSIAAAKVAAGGRSVSPYATNLRVVARAAAPRGGHVPAARLRLTGLKPPYTADELARLLDVGRGMDVEHRMTFTGALALGAGCGLIGDHALAVDAADLVIARGAVWVPCAWAVDGVLPVGGRWGEVLATVARREGGGPVTDVYTTAGAQRLKRRLARSTGAPTFDASRLRTTWICGLLARGVPVDVVARAADVSLTTLATKYLPHVPDADEEEVRSWLSGNWQARPPARDGELVPPLGRPRAVSPEAGRVEGEETVRRVLAAFTPADEVAAAAWAAPIGAELRALIEATTADPGRGSNLARATSVLLAWAGSQPGMPLELRVLLKASTLDRWACRPDTTSLSMASYRSLMYALADAAGMRPLANLSAGATTPVAQPFSDDELCHLGAIREDLEPRDLRVLDAHFALALGGGAARHEVGRVTPREVLRSGSVLSVRLGDRVVPVRPALWPALIALVEGAGAGPLTGVVGGRLTRPLARISEAVGFEFAPSRLRANWIVTQLDRAVPLHVLTAASGTQLTQLNSLATHLAARPAADAHRWLLAGGTTPLRS